jgi:DNA gyrase subunit A
MGRATQGVRVIKLNEEDSISSVEKIHKMEEPDATITDVNS